MGVTDEALGQHGGRGLGAFSWNVIHGTNPDSSQDEHVLVQGKRTDHGGGEFYLGLKRPGGGSDDESMVTVLEVTHEGGFDFRLPIRAPGLGTSPAPGGGNSPRFHHEGGGFVTIYQNDGNIATYDKHGTEDESRWTPVWSSFGGKV
jgi:hypothetical protein